MSVDNYNKSQPLADKMLKADGSITTFSNELISGPNADWAEEYKKRQPLASKFLLSDGTITDEFPGGGGGGGGGGVEIHRLSRSQLNGFQIPLGDLTIELRYNSSTNSIQVWLIRQPNATNDYIPYNSGNGPMVFGTQASTTWNAETETQLQGGTLGGSTGFRLFLSVPTQNLSIEMWSINHNHASGDDSLLTLKVIK